VCPHELGELLKVFRFQNFIFELGIKPKIMSFLSTYDIIRQILGLPPKEPSRIRIDRGPEGFFEFTGWKITSKRWKHENKRIVGNVYKTDKQKVVLEFKMYDFSNHMLLHKAMEYESVSDAVKDMQTMQGKKSE
jgi:hypothetical protein